MYGPRETESGHVDDNRSGVNERVVDRGTERGSSEG